MQTTLPKIVSLILAAVVLLFAVMCYRLSVAARKEKSDAAEILRLMSVLAVVVCVSVVLFIFSM